MHYDLATPVTDDTVRQLRINDTVTLQNLLFGIRDATQIALFDRGRATRMDLAGHAVIHTAPNVRKVEPTTENPAGYAPLCIGTTTSMRMERFTRPLMQCLGVRIIIGKGGLGPASLAAFAELGGVYVAIIGGTAALETQLSGAVNLLGIGPQGLGGDATAFAVHVELAATHITMNPVAVNMQCHSARRARALLTADDVRYGF